MITFLEYFEKLKNCRLNCEREATTIKKEIYLKENKKIVDNFNRVNGIVKVYGNSQILDVKASEYHQSRDADGYESSSFFNTNKNPYINISLEFSSKELNYFNSQIANDKIEKYFGLLLITHFYNNNTYLNELKKGAQLGYKAQIPKIETMFLNLDFPNLLDVMLSIHTGYEDSKPYYRYYITMYGLKP